MRKKIRLGLALLGLATVVAWPVGCDRHPKTPARVAEPAVAAGEIGSRLPEFSVKDFQGHEISSADYRGKVVIVDFWATWCEPCKREMPGYQELLDRYGPKGLAIIGFKFDTMTDSEDPLRFARKLGIHYPLAVASEDLKGRFGGIPGIPTTMIYDRQGILREKVIGFEYTGAIELALKPLL